MKNWFIKYGTEMRVSCEFESTGFCLGPCVEYVAEYRAIFAAALLGNSQGNDFLREVYNGPHEMLNEEKCQTHRHITRLSDTLRIVWITRNSLQEAERVRSETEAR